jgi:hypothetical protein
VPSASAFVTWRCVRNQSNQCGNSVKTSISHAEELLVDVDLARLESTRSIASETNGISVPSSSSSTEQDGPSSTRATRPSPARAAHEVGREPLALAELVLHQQQLAAHGRAVVHAAEPDQRPLVGARARVDAVRAPGERDAVPSGSSCRGPST